MQAEPMFTLEDVPMLSGVLASALRELGEIESELRVVKRSNHANSKFVKLHRRLDYHKRTVREVSQDIEELLGFSIRGNKS